MYALESFDEGPRKWSLTKEKKGYSLLDLHSETSGDQLCFWGKFLCFVPDAMVCGPGMHFFLTKEEIGTLIQQLQEAHDKMDDSHPWEEEVQDALELDEEELEGCKIP